MVIILSGLLIGLKPIQYNYNRQHATVQKAKGPMPNSPCHTDPQLEPLHPAEVEKQNSLSTPQTALKRSGRFLAALIFLAMLIGILLGSFLPPSGPALQKGQFVGVSISR